MWVQNSFQPEDGRGTGTLYLVPTPIGNLNDMTARALDILKQADILAAEDTRQTMKLCSHFDIHTPLVSYHEHNKQSSGRKLLQALSDGKNVALVTDAGTPAVSDPGYDLVVGCIEQQTPVVPLPGANAAVTGLIASGLATDHFLFYGFLPRAKKDKRSALESLSRFPFTLIFYESPFRVKETLQTMAKIFGDRRMALSRELTKRFECFIRGTISEVSEYLERGAIKGECCLIIEGAKESDEQPSDLRWWENLDIHDHVEHYLDEGGLTVKEAIKAVAVDRDVPKREVYQTYHQLKK